MLIFTRFGACFKGFPFPGKPLLWLQEEHGSVLHQQSSLLASKSSKQAVFFFFFPYIFFVFSDSKRISRGKNNPSVELLFFFLGDSVPCSRIDAAGRQRRSSSCCSSYVEVM